MMSVNLFAVVVAALASVGVGFLWYHPRVFGTMWMRLTGLSPDVIERGKKHPLITTLAALGASFLMAYTLSRFAFMWGVLTLTNALELAFWVWLGLVVPLLISPVLWEGRPWKLFLLNAMYWFVTITLMSVIVGLWI